MSVYLYLTAVVGLLLFLMFASCYIISMAYSLWWGAPYVASDLVHLNNVFSFLPNLRNASFIDLGCGDGRIVRYAITKGVLKGCGVDTNIFLIWLARWRSRYYETDRIRFYHGDVTRISLQSHQIIYLFLFPRLISRLQSSIAQCEAGTIIISHGFRIPYLAGYLLHTISAKPFSTYIYRIG